MLTEADLAASWYQELFGEAPPPPKRWRFEVHEQDGSKPFYQIDKHEKLIHVWLHEGQRAAWDSDRRFVFAIAGKQWGKCGQFTVLMADGRRKHVRDMTAGDEVLCLGDDLKICRSTVTAAFCTGTQPIFRVTTATGRSIIVTGDHPLYSSDGWKPTQYFNSGDLIGVPRQLPDLGNQQEDPAKMRVMGYLLGDGGLTTSSPMFSNVNDEILDDLRTCLPEPCQLVFSDRCTYRIKGYGRGNSNYNPVREWCQEWGMWRKLAKEKRIPEIVFTLSNTSIAPMLNALFACDGWVEKKGFGFASASEGLIDDVQHLLLRFGIISRKRYKCVSLDADKFDSWVLSVNDVDGLRILADQIGILSKQNKLESIISLRANKRQNGKDIIPHFDLASCYKKLGEWIPKKGYADQYGYQLVRRSRVANVSRSLAQTLSNYFNVGARDAYSDIYWDTIVSIDPIGDDTVWDITVADGHNFIADDFFAHNTTFGPLWLLRTILEIGAGDYLAISATFDLFKLKMLPALKQFMVNDLGLARYWAGDQILELCDPATSEFGARQASDHEKMWGRVILRTADSEKGMQSATAKAAWLDEPGLYDSDVWKDVRGRLSLNAGPALGTTTIYNMGWLKQQIYDPWLNGEGEIEVISSPSTTNPFFPQTEFDSLQRSMPAHQFAMDYNAQFGRPPAAIYEDFVDKLREDGGHKVKRFTIPNDWPRMVSIDPGVVNPGKVWFAHDPREDVYYLYRAQKGGVRREARQHAKDDLKTARELNERVIWWAIGAKSEKYWREDYRTEGAQGVREPDTAEVEEGIDRATQLIRQHRVFVMDDEKDFIGEIMSYSREIKNGEVTKNIKDKATFHLMDAFRYFAVQVIKPRADFKISVTSVKVT